MSYHRLKEISDTLIEQAGALTFVRHETLNKLTPAKQTAILLKGARGVGKSTVLQQYLFKQKKENHAVLYISADNTLLQGTLSELAYDYQKRAGEYLVIDEIHKYPNWQAEVKTIVDAFPHIKLLASGSSSINLDYYATDLSRRHIMIEAQGLSFREYVHKETDLYFSPITIHDVMRHYEDLVPSITSECIKNKFDLLSLFKKYLIEGYYLSRDNFPNTVLYFDSLLNAVNSAIESDLSYTYKDITNDSKQKIKRLLKHIAQLCPFVPNISELSHSLGIANDNTLKKYLFYLNQSEILTNLYSANKSYKDFPKPQKILLDNPNLVYAYTQAPSMGTIRETFVANCLKSQGQLTAPKFGDFCFNHEILFEVGGKSKNLKQIKSIKDSYILADDVLNCEDRKIPLWLIGFLW